MRYVKHNVSA